MAELLNISINLSKLDKARLTEDKNGNKWLNMSGWLNDAQDDFGNYGFLTHTPTKEERDNKERLTILGNMKKPIAQPTQRINKNETATDSRNPSISDEDDLPF